MYQVALGLPCRDVLQAHMHYVRIRIQQAYLVRICTRPTMLIYAPDLPCQDMHQTYHVSICTRLTSSGYAPNMHARSEYAPGLPCQVCARVGQIMLCFLPILLFLYAQNSTDYALNYAPKLPIMLKLCSLFLEGANLYLQMIALLCYVQHHNFITNLKLGLVAAIT